jgi:hypothetical protein
MLYLQGLIISPLIFLSSETFENALNFFIACKNDDEDEYWRILSHPLEKFGAFWQQHLEDVITGYGIVSYCTVIRPI